jgi:hypothetical protein
MVRAMSILLSFWLTLLFVVGLGAYGHIPPLMVWAVGLAAAFSGLGGIIAPMVGARLRLVGPLLLSAGLLTLWAVGVKTHVQLWLPWCIFMGTTTYLGVVIAEVLWSPRNRGTMAPADS